MLQSLCLHHVGKCKVIDFHYETENNNLHHWKDNLTYVQILA